GKARHPRQQAAVVCIAMTLPEDTETAMMMELSGDPWPASASASTPALRTNRPDSRYHLGTRIAPVLRPLSPNRWKSRNCRRLWRMKWSQGP
ncbi:unnamed protein product, partial [Ectocarpus sp. 12 AP-2014]